MANIIVNHNMAGLTAAEARATLKSASWRREEVEFKDGMGNSIDVPAKSDIALVITQIAQAQGSAGGFKVAKGTADYLEQWEKTFAVGPLSNNGYFVDARDTSTRYGEPKEWDSFAISVDQSVSDQDLATIRQIIIEELQSPEVLGMKDASGNTIPFKGMNGKRAIFISQAHDNTGNKHLHVLTNRFAFDMQAKEVSVAVDFSKSGVVQTVVDNIEARMRAEGMQYTFGALTSKSKAITQNTQALQAQANTQQQLSQAGGQAPGRANQVGVTVPVAPGQTMVVAAPLSPDSLGMQQQSVVIKGELESINREIERLQASASAKAESAAKLDQAVQALADNEVLRSTLEDTQAQLVESTATGEQLQAANASLTVERDQTEEARQTLHDAMLNIGINLLDKQMLGIEGEQAEDLQRGNVQAIGAVVDSLGKQVSHWNEAVDKLPDDMAEALSNDVDALNNLVDELLNKRQLTTELTEERDGLKRDLATANMANGELQGKLTTMESDMADLQARMALREAQFERQMAEQAEKVRTAEVLVSRAEGALQAKQEQLVEEQAEVKKLIRIKDTIVSVMTSANPAQSWEQSKDGVDDEFAKRAMSALVRTHDNLDKAQQRIDAMQNELANLGQMREKLATAQATVEENLGLMNDAGVANLRTLVQEHKQLVAGNEALQQQVQDLAQTAQAGQGGQVAPVVDAKLQSALELLRDHPALSEFLDEARSNDVLLKTLLDAAGAQNSGVQPAQGPTGQGTDYTQGLTDDNSNNGPKKNDPDQSNNR
jgi:DNA repair exonuclease SbcCD ATPase subunit